MNYCKKITSIFLAFLIVSCSSIAPSIDENILIKMEKSACYGKCPIYTVIVKKNGELAYEGKEYVSVEGVKSSVISKESLTLIEEELVKTKFLSMQSKLHSGSWNCFVSATDHSYILIEASVKNNRKAVSTYTGCNSEQVSKVIELAAFIEKTTEISKWVKQNP